MAPPEVRLIKEPDDPLCLRVSVGGTSKIGYYCVFRGDKQQVIACVRAILAALEGDVPVREDEEGLKGGEPS